MVRRKKYSDDFKRMVVQEYVTGDQTCREVVKKYRIRSNSAIQKWMHELGYPVRGRRGKPTFEPQIHAVLANNKQQPTQQELQKRIRELERQLEDEKLRSEAFSRIIDKTEKEFKISIRKKPNTK